MLIKDFIPVFRLLLAVPASATSPPLTQMSLRVSCTNSCPTPNVPSSKQSACPAADRMIRTKGHTGGARETSSRVVDLERQELHLVAPVGLGERHSMQSAHLCPRSVISKEGRFPAVTMTTRDDTHQRCAPWLREIGTLS